MLTTLGISFLASHLTEVVVAINKKLQGTFLEGDAAFLLSLGMALAAALVKVFYIDGTPLPSLADFSTWQTLAPTALSVWALMQIYFTYVMKQFGLTVEQPAQATQTGAASYSVPTSTSGSSSAGI